MLKLSFTKTFIFGNACILIAGSLKIPFTAINVFYENYSPESNIQVIFR